MGIMRNIPYYYIGYVMGQHQLFSRSNVKHDFLACIVCLGASILFFHWHLQAFFGGQHMLHIVLFYPANLGFLFGVLYGCKLLDKLKSSTVTNISIGTLVIIGLHIVAVTIANYAIGYLFDIKEGICYQLYEALPVTLVIVALLYPIILFAKKHARVLIGR
jgi:hypothetical protein